MKVSLLQIDIAWGNPEENILRVGKLMETCEGSDLYVLPEMWSTGFATQPEGIAPDVNHNIALDWMRTIASAKQCAVCGSLAVRLPDGSYRNRHYFIDGRHHHEAFYDKHHLFTYGGENNYYTAGQDHVMVEYEGFRILLLTCYDLRFPCWSRYADDRAYDMIVVVANWPQSRQSAWQILTRARAIENQAYLIGVNRVGDDDYSHYVGASCVIDPIGRKMGQCHRDRAESLTVELSLDKLRHRRTKFRVLDDRD
ncbi:MAG: nitrilase family protein [Prevotella sp.]|nr:nitrilase family protein [Prevotella sp.]